MLAVPGPRVRERIISMRISYMTAVAVSLGALAFGGAGCKSSLAYYQDGVRSLKEQKYEDAVASFSSAIEKDQGSDLAYLNRGDAYMEQEKYGDAISDYAQAIAIADGDRRPNPWYYNRRGLANYSSKHYQAALDDWREAQKLEGERQKQGLKVRKAQAYVDMQALREEYLPDVERQAVLQNEQASAPPVVAPVTPAPEPTPEVAPVAAVAAVAAGTAAILGVTAADEAAALDAARVAHESSIPAPIPVPVPVPAADTAAEDAAIAEAAKTHGAAVDVKEQEEAAAAAATAAAAKASEEAAAVDAARKAHESAAAVPTPAPVPVPVPIPAPGPARPARAANLAGTFVREADGVAFNFSDDGSRAVAEVAGTDVFAHYEVTLTWKTDKRLVGMGVMKENFSPCKFEATVNWAVEVVSADEIKVTTEDVEWDEACKEVGRTPVEHVLARKKK